jgi:predicted RecA/RadA family phage recombinase
MAKATYKRGEIRTIKYTTGAEETVEADDVIAILIDGVKSRVGVARQNIGVSSTGIVAVSGVFEFPKKEDDVIRAGDPVNYDPAQNTTGAIRVQHGTAPDNGVSRFGIAMENRGNPSTTVDVDISEPGVGDIT